MSPLSLFHSVAWWSLVVLVTASAVNVSPPQAGNDDAPMEPHSVKDMLHFLGKMKADENLGKKFVEVLVKDVEKYLDTNMVAKKKYEDNLADFLQHVEKLRNGLLNNPNDFGKYKDLTESVMLKDLEVLVQWIPILHTEFWFFYFLTSIEADTLVWKDLVDARYSQVPTGSRAIQWLTDKVKPVEDKYAVQRGFTDADIKERDMSIGIVAGNLGINYYGGGPLNYMQYGLFFFSGDALHPSNLASAMLFLAEFCREVNEDKFPEKTKHDKYKCLKDVCKDLAKKIDDLHKLLMPLYYPLEMPNPSGGNDEFRVALATLHKGDVPLNELYKGKLRADKFDDYVTWMTKNIGNLISLLNEMHSYSVGWNEVSIDHVKTYGPFRFGYTFVDIIVMRHMFYKLQQTINDIADLYSHNTLFSLLMCLDHERAVSERRLIEDKTREFRRRRPPPKEAFEDFPIPGEDDEEDGPNDLPNKGKKGGKRRGQRHGQKGGAQDRPQTVPDGGVAKEASFSAYSLRVVTALLALLSVM